MMRELKKEDGTTITAQTEIIFEVRSFFETLYNDEEEVSQEIMGEMVKDIPSIISPEDWKIMEAPITEKEIKKAI